MRILFIEIETESQWAHAAMGPACIGACLRIGGHAAALMRVKPDQTTPAILSDIEILAPDLVGFSITTRQWRRAARLAGKIRDQLGRPTIAGGLHATFAPESLMASGAFDYLCIGEGEAAVEDLLSALESNAKPEKLRIRNIWVRGQRRPDLRPPFAPLDTLPFAARDLLDELSGVAHMNTMRGCPFPCTYCAAGALDNLYGERAYIRRRSVDNVIAELSALRATGPLHYVVFLDDTFTLNRQWVEAFGRAFGREIGTGYTIHARAETLGRSLLKLLAETGCRQIVIGVESGSRRVREDVLKRPGSNQRYVHVFNWIRQAGMLATANYMIGIPGETAEDIAQTLALHRRLLPDDFGYFVFYPHPGTALTETCLEKGYLTEDYLDHPVDYGRSVLTLPGISRAEIAAFYDVFSREREKLYQNRNR